MTDDAEPERKARQREAWKTWMAANPGWRQEFEERNKEHLRAQKSEWHKLNRARQRKQATKLERGRAYREANRDHERERSRLFREQHPEKVREFARRYKERHPERAAENSRRGTQRYRDRNADAQREAQRVAAAVRRAENPDGYRDWYQANLEQQRERGRQASRLRSRLKALGLPPRHIQRIYAEQKRAHAAAADEYFSRKRKVPERREIGLEAPGAIPKLPPARHASENLPTPPHLLELFARQSAVARLRWMARATNSPISWARRESGTVCGCEMRCVWTPQHLGMTSTSRARLIVGCARSR